VEAVVVDGESHEGHVGVACEELGELIALLDAHCLEGQVWAALVPCAQPFRGTHPGDITEPQRHSVHGPHSTAERRL
jgi:hypothetical protein